MLVTWIYSFSDCHNDNIIADAYIYLSEHGFNINGNNGLGMFYEIITTCFDNIKNQDETDIDCGGHTCARQFNINQTCSVTSDCNNATCVDGIFCNI